MQINFTFLAITLNRPELLLVIIPFTGLILWQRFYHHGRGPISFSGLGYALRSGLVPATHKQNLRVIIAIVLVVIAGLVCTYPELRSSRPLLIGPSEALRPVYLIALDVSGSMTEPLGGYVVNGQLNLDGPTRYEASETEVIEFAENHSGSQLGLILFSIQPMLVRWPTLQTEFNFHDVLDEGMRFTNPLRDRTSQLAQFAGGTATLAGLNMARDTLISQRSSTRSLILIGDLIDNIDEVVEGVRDLHEHNIYVHVIALDAPDESLGMFASMFGENENIRLFSVKSQEELNETFDEIESIEKLRLVQGSGLDYVHDMQWLISLAGFFTGILMMVLYETSLHKTHL